MMETALAVAGTATGVALVNKISDAIGWYATPHQVIRMASAEARAELIRARARDESANAELTELFQRAEFRSALEQAIEQANLEEIILKALPHLRESANPQAMDNDWIKNHLEKSRHVSDDEIQEWWARILAGEANKPGSYSKRAVNILSDLEKTEAQVFSNLCNFVWNFDDAPVPLILDTSHAIYTDSGINHGSCVYLDELGLVNYTPPIQSYTQVEEGQIVSYHDQRIELKELTNRRGLGIGQVTFSISGTQLYSLCDTKPVEGFVDYTLGVWQSQGVSLATSDTDCEEKKVDK